MHGRFQVANIALAKGHWREVKPIHTPKSLECVQTTLKGMNTQRRKTIVIVTHSTIDDASSSARELTAAKAANINVVTVGLGPINETQLMYFASQPAYFTKASTTNAGELAIPTDNTAIAICGVPAVCYLKPSPSSTGAISSQASAAASVPIICPSGQISLDSQRVAY